jgi:BolA protein
MKTIEQSLSEKLEKAFAPKYLQIQNDSHGHTHGGGGNSETHFTVVVVSEQFEGKSRVDRQRMVANLFDEERSRGLHALSQKVYTPPEWEKIKGEFKLDPPACRGGGKG